VNYLKAVVLQASLPVTTYCSTENKLAEISSSLRQPEQIQKDYSQPKLIIKSAVVVGLRRSVLTMGKAS